MVWINKIPKNIYACVDIRKWPNKPRREYLTLAARETGVSRHNGDPIKGPPCSLNAIVLWWSRNFYLRPHDAEGRQSLGQIHVWSRLFFLSGCKGKWKLNYHIFDIRLNYYKIVFIIVLLVFLTFHHWCMKKCLSLGKIKSHFF